MTHISKQLLPTKDAVALENQLAALIDQMNKRTAQSFISNLLTPTEKVVLIKRLAAVLMLHHGYSSYALEKVLRISSSTASKYRRQFLNGSYKEFLNCIDKKRGDAALLKKILNLLDNINAPLTKDRWRYLNRMK